MGDHAARPELLNRLRSRDASARADAARQLVGEVMELEASGLHGEQNPLYTELKQRLIKMTATSDPQERLAATALLSALANVDTLEESQMMRITTQTKTLMQGSDTTVCAEAMAIYRRLIQNRWVTVLSTVEMDVSRRLELLDGERSDVQRLMTLRLIEMLCSENLVPLYSYVSKIFARLSHPLRDQRIEIRTAAGRALGACLGLVPLTERNPRNTWLNFLFEEMRLNQQLGTVEALHGSLLICQELLQHGGMYMQSHFAQACETAMRLKDNRDAFVRRAAIEQLPMLARYSPQEFARVGASGESMLSRSCNYLITLSRTNDSERPTTLLALGNIAQNCSTEFRPFLEPAMGAIRYVLVQRAKARAAAADADDAVTAGALQAVAMLAAAMGPALTRHMRDILDLMFMTGLNQALCDALQALVREVGQLQPAVQGRLLDTVSVILVGMPFRPQQQSLDDLERRMGTMSMHYAATPGGPVPAGAMTNGVSHASSGSAAEPTSLVVRAASNIPVTPDTLVLALRTLRTFDFSEENLSEFLRNEVLKYTVHSSAAVRSEAIHTVAHIVLSDPLYRSMAGAGVEVASEVVQRLVSAAVVDVDRDVRLMAVHMLEKATALDFHMGKAQNIQDLFLLMNDEVFEVRLTVLAVIGRLANMNPAHVMPSLRRMVVQLLTELEYARSNREREECIQLLMVLVRAAENWVRPYVGDIFATILPRIDDAPPQLASKLLDTVAALARVGGSELVPYYDELLASIVRAVSDGTNAPKRMAALKALSSCASFCAMVIDPYTEYPQLFNILSAILKDNSDMEMRTEALRAVGALGAIDQHRFKDALSNTADGTSGGLGGGGAAPNGTPVGAAATTAVAALPAGAMQRKAGTAGRKTGAAGRKIDARRRRNRRRQGRVQPNVMTAFNSEKPVEALVGDIPSDACGIAFSSDEYYTTVAVNALLSILNDTADVASHQEAAQALTNMFAPLKAKAAPYIEHSLHAILAAMEVAPDSDTYVIFYIKRLHKLVETAHQLIRPHLSSLFKLFSTDALGSIQQQNESIDLLKALAEALVGDFGPHIAIVLPYLIAVIDRDASDARAPTENALSAIQVLSPSLEGYLFLVMPRLIALLDTTMNPRKIVEAALECIAALVTAVNCSSFASRIVLTLVRLLQSTSTPELQGAVVDVLCTLMEQLQDEFTLFMPTIEAAMGKRRGASTARYERNARMLFSGRLIPQERPRPVPQALSEAVQAASAPAHGPDGTARQDIDVMQLRRAWSAKQQATKDGWIRWLREFTCELLQQSPSNSLRACSSLASRHTRLGSDLFNAAFVSCWTMLPGQYQQEIIASLQSVASNRDVPADILQAILGLAEYMERDEKQIPIDLKLLGDYADRCHALAKELHYKEAEWTLEKNYETIKKLIELNQNLDLHDSAIGMLDYVRKEQEDIQESVDWYTRLQQWDKALVIYRRQETEGGLSRENTMGQVRCLFEMSDWTALVPLYERIWSGSDQQLQTASAGIGMSMAWATGDIDRMEFYLSALPSNSGDKSFCRALLAVYRNNFGDAAQYIDEARQAIDLDLSAQITESDSRGYSQMFQCQMLTELEEIITYKTSNDDTERQMNIVTTWRERLSGIQQDVSMWQRLLRLRSMVLRPILDLDTWIKYVNMSRKSGQLRIARDAIAQLLDDEAHYMEEINRGEMDAVPTKLQAQAHEYARLNAQMARQQQMSSGSVAGLLPTGPSASWEGRMRRFSSAGGASTNASLDMAIRLSQQPALVYMYLKYKWAANERREAFQMLQLFARDYAGKIGFDVHSPDAFAENIDARLLANLNGHADAASDGETVHLLARFYFKQAEWLSSVQQTVSLSREAQTKAGMGDAPYSRQAGHREENGRRRGRSSTLSGASAAAPRGNARASEDGRARQDAQFLYELNSERIGESILESYRAATVLDRKWYKAWHSLALRHYLETQWYENEHTAITEDIAERHVVPAVHGFFRAIQLSKSDTTLQDTLRLLTAWFNYSQYESVAQAVQDGFNAVPIRTWLQVIPQILARLHITSDSTRRLIRQLLVEVGKSHPQAILFSLYVAARSDHQERSHAAKEVLAKLHDLHPDLVEETEIVSRELIRITMLFPEMWQEALRNASSHYYVQHDVMEMMRVLRTMHKRTRNPETLREYHFVQMFGSELATAEALLVQYFAADAAHRNETLVQQAWDTYYLLFRRIDKLFPGPTTLTLKDTAPALLKCRDMQLAMPGTYDPDRALVTISSFDPVIYVYGTKQRPRRMYVYGSDGVKYTFLLKGREDLRQDERVMQLFGLINSLLARDTETSRRSLTIERFPVIPLSSNSGLIGFYPNCENINNLLRNYREAHEQPVNLEQRMALQFSPNWDTLTVMQKVESFEYALSNTPGNDLQRAMWYKAPSAEVWLERRTNYTRSLAVMSIAGYILGLGDRHPANILIHERTGKVVHIDLGDCFEIAAHREKFPEKVPFRLTRMLIMPMEVSSIEGTFKYTANHTMRVLRANRDSLMAVLEAFVFDPLVSWLYLREWEMGIGTSETTSRQMARRPAPPPPREGRAAEHAARWSMGNDAEDIGIIGGSKPDAWMSKAGNNTYDAMDGKGWQTGNPKARAIVKRIHDKLVGTDFNRNVQLTEAEQIDKLIQQATSSENLAVLYVGWVPLW